MKRAYRKIFWRIGQEITPETFKQADNYISAQHNLIRRLINRQYYGLFPVKDAKMPSINVNATLKGAEIMMEQLNCMGITRGGCLIDFQDSQLRNIRQKRLSITSQSAAVCYVVLRVYPFDHLLIEPVDNEETPFAIPVYDFEIRDLAHIEGNELPVLKINNNRQHPYIDWNYIPPSMSICSHGRLMEYYRNFNQIIAEILTLITQKKAHLVQLIYPVSSLIFDMEHFSLNEPPFYFIQLLKKIVKTIGLFIPEIQKSHEAVLKAPYYHDDIAGLLQGLIKCFQDIKMIIGKEEIEVEVEDLTPRI